MKLQKHYLEVSNSSRNEVRAFFRFIAERKNCEILRCVGLLKVFSKKHSFWGSKNSVTLQPGTILNSSRPGMLCPARTLFVMIVPPMPRRCAGFDAADNLLLPARNKHILPGLP
jgi:hypothetical protein